jgi:hypothetical protein
VGAAIGSGSAAYVPLARDGATSKPTDVPVVALGADPTAPGPELLVTDQADDPAPTMPISAALLGVGVGLFVARRVASRRRRVR